MGYANMQNNKNIPVFLGRGGFKHGYQLAFNSDNNAPLANLYVSMLQDMGLNKSKFASSTSSQAGLS